MIKSLISAFLMYSRIPMPQVEWKEENRRYALGFFPLVGAVIGALLILWQWVSLKLGLGRVLFGAGAALLPIAVTGGIHADGFCDAIDAKSAFADKAKRLEIMADPHVGSFAVIYLCGYMLMQAALFSQVRTLRDSAVIGLGYVVSRSLSGLGALFLKSAKSGGTLQSFVKPSHKKTAAALAAGFGLAALLGMIVLRPLQGALCALAAGGVFAFYRLTAYKNFGGITGDLCGYFLQLCEIYILAAAVLGERITGVLL